MSDYLPGESSKAHEAWAIYRDMGLGRTQAAVAKALSKSEALINGWAMKFKWTSRVRAFDVEQESVRMQARQKAIARVEEEAVEEYELSAKRTLLETARLGYADIRKAVSWDKAGNVDFTPSTELDDHTAAAISEFSVKYDKAGNPIKSIKFHNKIGALNLAGQHHNLWKSAEIAQQNIQVNQFFLNAPPPLIAQLADRIAAVLAGEASPMPLPVPDEDA